MRQWFKKNRLFFIAAILAALGLILTLAVIFAPGGRNPADYVAQHYTRAAELDRNGGRAYTSSRPPRTVSEEITDVWRPADYYADAVGIFLRYSNDVIVIFPRGAGSLIMIYDPDRAYRLYHSHIGSHWGWSSGVDSVRGGGPGAGK